MEAVIELAFSNKIEVQATLATLRIPIQAINYIITSQIEILNYYN